MKTNNFIKRFSAVLIVAFYQALLFGQTQYDYYEDDAVAGGADRALNGILLFIGLIILAVVILFVLGIGAKIYYWFNPEANPEFKRKIAIKEKEEIRAKEKIIQDKKQAILDDEKNRHRNVVDLGLSVMWADTNLFATSYVDKGGKFAWGDKNKRILFRYADCFLNEKWSWDLNKILGNDELSICGIKSFDAATFLWGECWRMPQMHEIKELLEKCEWEWTVIEGINGYKVKGKNGNFIFLPVTGENVVDEQKSVEAGFYWTGIASSDRNEAKYLFFNKENKSAKENGQRWHGMAIRPVWSPKKKTPEEILSQLESNSISQEKDYISEYNNYRSTFALTEKPETNDVMRDLTARKMYSADGKKLLSTWNGAGGKDEKIDINPRPGTQIISDNAYDDYNNRFENTISIPDSVYAIGNNAFMFLSPHNMTIPSSVKYITGNPFGTPFGYYNKVSCDTPYFKITDGELLSVDKTLYVANIDLEKKTKIIPNGVRIIGRGAIRGHNEVELIKLPNSIVALAENAISGCKNLTAIIFEGKTSVIEPTAIFRCDNLKAIFVPAGLLNYYQSKLSQQLSELIIELEDTSISEEEILHNIFVLEDKKKSIVNASEKNNILAPSKDDLEYIENLKKDYSLSVVTQEDWDEKVIDWGEAENEEHDKWDRGEASYSKNGKKFLSFEDNLEQYTLKEGVEILCDNSFSNGCSSKKIILPNTVRILGNFVFWQTDLGDFSIPASVKKITGNPFVSCDVNLTCYSSEFCVVNGILYDTAKTRIVSVINDINRIVDKNSMTFPSSIKEIGRYSFYEISTGGPVQLPPSVIYIGESAFEHTIISQIILNDKIVEIGKSAFAWSYVKRIDLPDSVIKLGESAFDYSKNLEYVRLSSSLQTIEEKTFKDCEKLNHVHIPEGVKIIKKDAFSWCKQLTDLYLPDSLEKIEEGAFTLCGFKTVVVPKQTVIAEGAFMENCQIIRRE